MPPWPLSLAAVSFSFFLLFSSFVSLFLFSIWNSFSLSVPDVCLSFSPSQSFDLLFLFSVYIYSVSFPCLSFSTLHFCLSLFYLNLFFYLSLVFLSPIPQLFCFSLYYSIYIYFTPSLSGLFSSFLILYFSFFFFLFLNLNQYFYFSPVYLSFISHCFVSLYLFICTYYSLSVSDLCLSLSYSPFFVFIFPEYIIFFFYSLSFLSVCFSLDLFLLPSINLCNLEAEQNWIRKCVCTIICICAVQLCGFRHGVP